MKCIKCGQELEYDEGEGNIADGYICFECISEVDIIIIDKNKPKQVFVEEYKINPYSKRGYK